MAPPVRIRLADLFSGCGGMTLGFLWDQLLEAGDTNPILRDVTPDGRSPFRSILANDFNDDALATYSRNFDPQRLHTVPGSIEHLLAASTDLPVADVVVGGPPCQGFSLLNKWREGDARRSLWWQFLEIAQRVDAKIVVMENVSQLLGSSEFQSIWTRLGQLGFKYRIAHVLCAANYGVPQVRNRAIIIASRETPVTLPAPSHLSPKRLGLLAGRVPDGILPWRTVGDAIAGLGSPIGVEPRTDVDPAQSLHFGRRPTEESKLRYRAVPEGGNRFDLLRNAPEITPACWVRKKSGGTDLFGRLWNDRPSVTIRTEFYKPEKGRYLHPTSHRPITHREAARLQSFPDRFEFSGSKIEIARQIGNAVPPLLAYAIARAVRESLSGSFDTTDMFRMRDLFRAQLGERVDALVAYESRIKAAG